MDTVPADVPPTPLRSPEDLAADFLVRQADGEGPDLEHWSRRLRDEAERAAFRQLVADACSAQESLPLRVGSGTLLDGRYTLGRELGAGGTGRVYEADDAHGPPRVAIKVLADFSPVDLGPESAFIRDAAVLAELGRPDIAAIRAVGSESGVRFLVEDLVPGGSLATLIGRTASAGLPDADARAWWQLATSVVHGVATAVEAAHAHSILHGGLKPENIMLREDGRAVVLDFGLRIAHGGGDSAIARGLFGNVASLPPELARRGAAGPDARQDVYQLGLVLHEFLTRSRPFGQGGLTTLLERISLGDLARPRELDRRIPPALETLCLRALEVDPARRHPTMSALREDLRRCLASGGGSLVERLRTWWSRGVFGPMGSAGNH